MEWDSERYHRDCPEHGDAADYLLEFLRVHEGCTINEMGKDLCQVLPSLGLLWEEGKIRTDPQGDPAKPFSYQSFHGANWLDTVRFFTNA